jgi:hypothetical protein
MAEQINPLQNVFTWLCQQNNIPQSNHAGAAVGMRGHVANARRLYLQPIGRQLPYHNPHFRAAYLLAYFPYYIEPIFHTLQAAEISDSLFAGGRLNLALFGGGPCPELLGVTAWLRRRAPQLESLDAVVFDREPGWSAIQEGLIPAMLDDYRSTTTSVTLAGHGCDVVECPTRDCSCGVADRDLIVSQNFLTELYGGRQQALQTFERIIRTSRCRYLVFVENRYEAVRELMDRLAADLFSKGLITRPAGAAGSIRVAGFPLPPLLREHLFTGEDGLIPRKYVKYHSMVLEIRR